MLKNSPATLNRWSTYRKNREDLKMSPYDAAISAGYPRSLAEKHQGKTLTAQYANIFAQKGLTRHARAQKLIDGTNAMKVTYDKAGIPHRVEDWPTRIKALEVALKLCGDTDDKAKKGDTFILNLAERMKEARERVYANDIIDVTPKKEKGSKYNEEAEVKNILESIRR